MTVTNPATATTTLTGVSLYDPVPAGVSYVAASGSVTCELASNVRDQFDNPVYTGNNGTTTGPPTGSRPTPTGRSERRWWRRGGGGRVRGGHRQRPAVAVPALHRARQLRHRTACFTGNNGSNMLGHDWTEDNDDNNATAATSRSTVIAWNSGDTTAAARSLRQRPSEGRPASRTPPASRSSRLGGIEWTPRR